MSSHGIHRNESDIELQSLNRPSSQMGHRSDTGSDSGDDFASILNLYQHDHDEELHGLEPQAGHGSVEGEIGAGIGGLAALDHHDGAGSSLHHGEEGGPATPVAAGSVAAPESHEGDAPESRLTNGADWARKIATAMSSGVGVIGTGLGAMAPAGSQMADAGHDLGVVGSSLGVLGNLGNLAVGARKGELSVRNNWTDAVALAANAASLGFNAYKVSQQGSEPAQQPAGQG